MNSFKELKVWQKAHELTILIYKISAKFPIEERFALLSQIRRASVSVPSNIAEGFTRNSYKVALNFYDIADGSLEEVRYQLLLSKDLAYITEGEYKNALSLIEEVSKMLHSWIRTQNSLRTR